MTRVPAQTDPHAESAERYRTLLDSIDQGFCICEMLIDEAGVAYDYRFVEVNHLFSQHTGLYDAQGRTARELVPDLELQWVRAYAKVALDRVPLRFELASRAMGDRLFDVHAFPFGAPESRTFAILFKDITDQNRTKEQLRQTRARLQAALDSGLAGTFYLDIASKRIVTDHNMMRYFSLPARALDEGVSIEEVLPAIHDEDRSAVAAALSAAMEHAIDYDVEYRVNHADGTTRWLAARGTVERDEHQRPRALPGFTFDITERKHVEADKERLLELLRAEQASLQASEERYRAIVESQSEMVCRFRPEGAILFANRAYARARGTTPEQLIGETFWNFVAEPDRPAVRAQLAQLTPETPEVRIENRFETTTEGVRWTLWTNRALEFDRGGRATEVQSTGIDITERKRREEHADFLAQISAALGRASDDDQIMRAVAERLGRHLGALRCMFTEYDEPPTTARVIHDWTRDGAKSVRGSHAVHGYLSSEALRLLRTGEMLIVNDVAADPRTHSRRAHYAAIDVGSLLNTPYIREGHWKASLTIQRQEPSVWTADEIALLRDLAGRIWTSIDRARADRRLRESEAELREASQMKDEFLATLSHELRTPLNAVLGWAHLLRTAGLPEDVAKRGFEALERNARVQSQLVDDLLDMSRIISGKLQIETSLVSLQSIAGAAIETVRPSAVAKGVSLSVASDPADDFNVSGDGDRLRQVVWNLLSNAVKFTPCGGRVDLSLQRAPGYVEIAVRDTGEGIEPTFLPVVFDRFRQADGTTTRRHGGLGLGLAIVRHLTEAHGGTVTAASEGANHGATFTVRLPTAGGVSSTAAVPHPRLPVLLHGARVLVVDDQLDARELARVALETRGATVTTAGSAEEALGHLQHTVFDILLADIGMPERDGFWLIRTLRASDGVNAKLPAVAVTAYASVAERDGSLEAGYQRHLPKPVDQDLLVETISALIFPASRLSRP